MKHAHLHATCAGCWIRRYVWYLGCVKFIRDIASFGLIFWAPTIVNSLIEEMVGAGGACLGRGERHGRVVCGEQFEAGTAEQVPKPRPFPHSQYHPFS